MSKANHHLREVQLPYLETFSSAAEHCNFTKAGKTLGITQAAVSQRIHALERLLGKPLFERKGTRVLLTEAGKTLYEYARQILDLHQAACAAITGRAAPLAGELLLAASSVPGEHLLPDLLSAFRARFPEIHVRAVILDSIAVVKEVEHGNVHLGLVGRKVDSPVLEFRPFAADEMALIVPADHRWGKRKVVPFSQFAREPLVVREPGSGSRWCLEQALSTTAKSLRDVNVVLELGSNEAIKEAVLKGIGITVLSTRAVQKECASGRLHTLAIAGLSLERWLFLVRDTRRALPNTGRVFANFLESTGPNLAVQ